MGVPTSEVGYTSAMPKREDHEVHKDMWGGGHWKKLYYKTRVQNLSKRTEHMNKNPQEDIQPPD